MVPCNWLLWLVYTYSPSPLLMASWVAVWRSCSWALNLFCLVWAWILNKNSGFSLLLFQVQTWAWAWPWGDLVHTVPGKAKLNSSLACWSATKKPNFVKVTSVYQDLIHQSLRTFHCQPSIRSHLPVHWWQILGRGTLGKEGPLRKLQG